MGKSERGFSAKVLKWCGFETSEQVQEWFAANMPDEASESDMQVDHIIPFHAFTWRREGLRIVRENKLDEAEFRKLWHRDNLQLLLASANHQKAHHLPSDEILLKLRHLWPSWWQDQLPSDQVRNALKRKGMDVLGVG